ncbi:cyclic di-GMP phosphodiesterase [Cronobacter dublinensis]|uniref:cyclic di-GMP phosphodiesterase n=1 Tax=Cronobacter dublinensis TaxID=413497 RepID=UPI000CFD12EA|nr:cyclic di-GMP phosphodiesterase [Cronobacter dublinensis]EGT5661454.1 cyclic di-GMP phosphodiesterase [Cronobacter dublinensis subsp. dublinensis]EGT5667686.1 cyclic di-GMP phosphodiesterase [Cronobacter dublinensis subsp. dublinensis]EGT5672271.1 cyclic di-GMP phosphodiesterase [Cronobacter dublinensis subsp. dublinensis]EGT5676322.1 cyclic di-GMP phosphodiesterase [Cronobacter dublinensis subsp. dublinensis]EGT5684122.1 cyclic di-GMP phosphodiesterase [Cronobacter dublinensis subsp. dubli
MLSSPPFASTLSTPRKILLVGVATGLVLAFIVTLAARGWLHQQRENQYDMLARDIHHYLNTYFAQLKASADALQPLTLAECGAVSAELTSRAAFNVNVRAFLLLRNGAAYCSSATGRLQLPLRDFAPDIDTRKAVDISIITGTPMMPDKPSIVMWFGNPLMAGRGIVTTLNVNLTPYLVYTARQNDLNGLALVAKDRALTTFSGRAMTPDELPAEPLRSESVRGYPLKLYLYGDTMPAEDRHLALLLGLLLGVLGGVLTVVLLALRARSGREIVSGIKRNQFFVVYQPVVDAATRQIRGVEALMRWKHPAAGMIPPDAFISFAEAQGLIVPLTRHLFKLIAQDVPHLQQSLPPGSKLGINIAPGHLHSPEFQADIQKFHASLPPDYFQLVFEITERDMIREKEAIGLFEWLHQQGYEIAVDDFGTGHSALIYLERFTLDYLKIDRGFVNAIGTETITSPVLDAVISLAKRLNMATVAEGVETQEQAKWLSVRGVNFLQGYYFSRPVRAGELPASMKEMDS